MARSESTCLETNMDLVEDIVEGEESGQVEMSVGSLDLTFIANEYLSYGKQKGDHGRLDLRKIAHCNAKYLSKVSLVSDWGKLFAFDKDRKAVNLELCDEIVQMYWDCEPNEKVYLCPKFKEWFEKNPPPDETINNYRKRLEKDRKTGGGHAVQQQSLMSAFLNGTKPSYGSYFRGNVSKVTAALAVKLHQARGSHVKNQLPARILQHANDVLTGPNSHVWKQAICLPKDLRVKFPDSLEEEEANVKAVLAPATKAKRLSAPKVTRPAIICHTFAPEKEALKLKIENLRKAAEQSMADMYTARQNVTVAREYVKVVDARRKVADKMAEEWGDESYAKFELKMWLHLSLYFKSGRSQVDKDTLTRAIGDDIATFEAIGAKRAERIVSCKGEVPAQVVVKEKPPNVLRIRVPVNPKLATRIPKAKPAMATEASEVPIDDKPDSVTETVDSIEKVDTVTSANETLIVKTGTEASLVVSIDKAGSKATPGVSMDKTGAEGSGVHSNARNDGATDSASSDEVTTSDKSGFAAPVDKNGCSAQKSNNCPAEAEYRDPDVSLVMNASFDTTDDKGEVIVETFQNLQQHAKIEDGCQNKAIVESIPCQVPALHQQEPEDNAEVKTKRKKRKEPGSVELMDQETKEKTRKDKKAAKKRKNEELGKKKKKKKEKKEKKTKKEGETDNLQKKSLGTVEQVKTEQMDNDGIVDEDIQSNVSSI